MMSLRVTPTMSCVSSEGRSASIVSLATTLAERHPAEHARCFAFDGWRLELRSNTGALLDTVGAYLELFAASPGPCDVTVSAYETDAPQFGLPYFDWKRGAGKIGKKEQCADLNDGWGVRKVRTGMHFLL